METVSSQRRTRRDGLGPNYRKLWLAHGVSNLALPFVNTGTIEAGRRSSGEG